MNRRALIGTIAATSAGIYGAGALTRPSPAEDWRSLQEMGLIDKLWTFRTPGHESVYSSPIGPITVRDGAGVPRQAVILVTQDWYIYALSVADGSVIWRKATGGTCYGRCQAGDVNGDGRNEIFAPSHDGHIWSVDDQGGNRWQFPNLYAREATGTFTAVGGYTIVDSTKTWAIDAFVRSDASGTNAILKVTSGKGAGQAMEISGSPGGGRLYFFNNWTTQPAVGDSYTITPRYDSDNIFMHAGTLVNEGGAFYLYATCFDNHIYKINANTGALVWKFACRENIEPYPLIFDVDGDGATECVTACIDGFLRCHNTQTGALKWRVNTGQCDAFLSCGDINGDGVVEILVSSRDNRVYIVRGTDGVVLNSTTDTSSWDYGDIDSMSIAHKVPGEAFPRIYTGGDTGTAWCFDKDGYTQWSHFVVPTAINSSPFLHDVDGDGEAEILIGDMRGTLWIFNARTGGRVGCVYVKGGIEGVPLYADIDGDGRQEMVITTTDGYAECYRFRNGAKYSTPHWPGLKMWAGAQ